MPGKSSYKGNLIISPKTMRNAFLLILGIGCVAGLQMIMSEDLVQESGAVSALSLPLAQESSTRAFETATFGLG